MNVEDVADDSIPQPTAERDRLDLIFERQRHLLDKYHPIEERNGLLQCHDVPVPIHDKFGQARIKDFLWRVTEEITEATASVVDDGLKLHFIEELSDAFHFFVELLIISGYTPQRLHEESCSLYMLAPEGPGPQYREPVLCDDRLECHMQMALLWSGWRNPPDADTGIHCAYDVIEFLGRAGNTLKQKPWKQTHMLTDENHYRLRIVQAYFAFLNLCRLDGGMTFKDLYEIYYKKSEVNRFRQRSMY